MSNASSPRGRPRTSSIPRFNVATDLIGNKKFIRFRRILGITEKDAFAILLRVFNYVAANSAFEPRIEECDLDILASFCWFDGEPTTLMAALITAGFLNPDLSIHDWFDHQPWAEKVVSERKPAKDSTSANRDAGELSHDKSPKKTLSGTKSGTKIKEENLIQPIPPTPLPATMIECHSMPEPPEHSSGSAEQESVRGMLSLLNTSSSGKSDAYEGLSEPELLCMDFCNKYGYTDPQTCAALSHRIQICGALHGLDCVRRMFGEIAEDSSIRDPIKVLYYKLNRSIDVAKSVSRLESEVAAG
jgi:hypothetical protein